MGIKCLGSEREFSQDIFCLYESQLRGWGGRWEVGGREVCVWISIGRFQAFITLRVMLTSFARTAAHVTSGYTGCFIMFSVITNIYNKKTKGPTLMELFTATGKMNFIDNSRCSMFAPLVTRHTSIRYSSSCHTHVNMGASIFFTAAMIRAFRSARSRGNGGTNTLHEMHVAQ